MKIQESDLKDINYLISEYGLKTLLEGIAVQLSTRKSKVDSTALNIFLHNVSVVAEASKSIQE